MDALKLIAQDCLRADKPVVAVGDTEIGRAHV